MATLTYALKNPQEKISPIIAMLTDGRDYKIKLYPGFSIPSKAWSKRNKCLNSSYSDAVSINTFLDQYRIDVLQILLHAKMNGLVKKVPTDKGSEYQPKANYYKNEIDKLRYQRSEMAIQKLSFWKLWELFLKTRDNLKKRTSSKYKTLGGHLLAFEDATHRLDLDTLSDADLEDFQTFCYTSRGLNTESTSGQIGLFKTFLNWCIKRKHTMNADFRNFKSIRQPNSIKVIMTKEELERIESLQLQDQPYLHNARQLFLLSCDTGLRFSDYSKIKEQHLKKNYDNSYELSIRLQKTDNDVEIPLTSNALKIVREIIAGKVHPISNQKMNDYVKQVAQKADIDEPVEKFRYQGKNKEILIKAKYECISTHTGRRTFATHMMEAGVAAEVVMVFTGHKDYKSFEKYINIPKQSQKDIIKKAQRKGGFMQISA